MKKIVYAIALMILIIPCSALFSACGCAFWGIPDTYTVTFVDWDDTVLDTQIVNWGEDADLPDDSVRTGYSFAGWEGNYQNIRADVIIKATYTKNTYVVTFKDYDDTILSTQTVEYGAAATAPANPTREGYTFTGWDKSFDNVTSNLTVIAIYTEDVAATYTVTFVDYDETTVLKTEIVNNGESATAPADPIREGYVFIGWNPADFSNVTFDLTITATYEELQTNDILGDWKFESINSLNITAENPNGETYNIGDTLDEVILTERYAYATFTESQVSLSLTGGNYTVNYSRIGNKYKTDEISELTSYVEFAFTQDDKLILNIYDMSGETAVKAAGNIILVRGAPAEEVDEFSNTSWVFKDLTTQAGEQSMVVNLGDKLNGYANEDAVTLTMNEDKTFNFGLNIPGMIFAFNGTWNSSNNTFTFASTEEGAQFPSMTGTYSDGMLTITVVETSVPEMISQGTIFNVQKALSESEKDPITGFWYVSEIYESDKTTLVGPYTEENIILNFYTYGRVRGWYADQEIIGDWVKNGENYSVSLYNESVYSRINGTTTPIALTFIITDNNLYLEVETQFYKLTKGERTFTVIFKNWDGTELSKQENIPYRGDATPPADPIREGYRFVRWNSSYNDVKSDNTIIAEFEEILYNVRFLRHDGTILSEQNVKPGSAVTAPETPEREGYDFVGWEPSDFTNITSNMTITAVYNPKQFTVTFVDYDGRVIKTDTVNYGGATFPPMSPTREGYNFTSWDKAPPYTDIKENITITAQYAIKTFSVVFRDHDGTVLSEQTVNYGEDATAPADPVREGFTFTGWSPAEFTNVTSDLNIAAIYSET